MARIDAEVAEGGPQLLWVGDDVEAVQSNVARGRLEQPGEDSHQAGSRHCSLKAMVTV